MYAEYLASVAVAVDVGRRYWGSVESAQRSAALRVFGPPHKWWCGHRMDGVGNKLTTVVGPSLLPPILFSPSRMYVGVLVPSFHCPLCLRPHRPSASTPPLPFTAPTPSAPCPIIAHHSARLTTTATTTTTTSIQQCPTPPTPPTPTPSPTPPSSRRSPPPPHATYSHTHLPPTSCTGT
ncbi:hypothetical protein BZA05DRAFT_68640 [Tricharina praecox]|uniref:uncharacterized protein n=1 Tax=Tricharina praecox TaxID=43433 RepID=UPI00221E74A6|nr:uncharacterized protein BZA05DRAFT_68640 [Tricharina praecox]KAI5850086.1 hypothetical protein BZA05DRAFT_68640 [Tricharina praecox]